MKYPIIFCLAIFCLFSTQTTTFAAETAGSGQSVYETINKGNQVSKSESKTDAKKQSKSSEVVANPSPSIFSILIKLIGSFILVIGLLFGLMRFLSKRNRLMQPNGPILSLGGHMLGNNRSLQVVLIGQTIYIVGVGDSVSLIREIHQGEEYQCILEGFETQAEARPMKWPGTNQLNWNSVFRKHLSKIKREMGED